MNIHKRKKIGDPDGNEQKNTKDRSTNQFRKEHGSPNHSRQKENGGGKQKLNTRAEESKNGKCRSEWQSHDRLSTEEILERKSQDELILGFSGLTEYRRKEAA